VIQRKRGVGAFVFSPLRLPHDPALSCLGFAAIWSSRPCATPVETSCPSSRCPRKNQAPAPSAEFAQPAPGCKPAAPPKAFLLRQVDRHRGGGPRPGEDGQVSSALASEVPDKPEEQASGPRQRPLGRTPAEMGKAAKAHDPTKTKRGFSSALTSKLRELGEGRLKCSRFLLSGFKAPTGQRWNPPGPDTYRLNPRRSSKKPSSASIRRKTAQWSRFAAHGGRTGPAVAVTEPILEKRRATPGRQLSSCIASTLLSDSRRRNPGNESGPRNRRVRGPDCFYRAGDRRGAYVTGGFLRGRRPDLARARVACASLEAYCTGSVTRGSRWCGRWPGHAPWFFAFLEQFQKGRCGPPSPQPGVRVA